MDSDPTGRGQDVGVIVDLFHSVFVCEERQLVGTNECGKVRRCTVMYGLQISWASLLERRPGRLDQEVRGRDKLCCWLSPTATAQDIRRRRRYKSTSKSWTNQTLTVTNVANRACVYGSEKALCYEPNSWILFRTWLNYYGSGRNLLWKRIIDNGVSYTRKTYKLNL